MFYSFSVFCVFMYCDMGRAAWNKLDEDDDDDDDDDDNHHHIIFFNKMPTKRSKYTMAKISANNLEQ